MYGKDNIQKRFFPILMTILALSFVLTTLVFALPVSSAGLMQQPGCGWITYAHGCRQAQCGSGSGMFELQHYCCQFGTLPPSCSMYREKFQHCNCYY